MGFMHSLKAFTEGIERTRLPVWRALQGVYGVYWEAKADCGAKGYYVSPDPRIVLFRNDVSSQIKVTNQDGGLARSARPMMKALYIPPGMPMWTEFSQSHRFSHLDLHLHQDWLVRHLTPALGRSAALSAIAKPTEGQNTSAVDTLADLFVEQLETQSHHSLFSENLASSIAAGIMELSRREEEANGHKLSARQMERLRQLVEECIDRKLSIAELSREVGMSESWFFNAFKATAGMTPLKWIQKQRIELAKKALADDALSIAETSARLGFSDQAHLTRVFRQVEGITPAAWLQSLRQS